MITAGVPCARRVPGSSSLIALYPRPNLSAHYFAPSRYCHLRSSGLEHLHINGDG
jgi:hypothetical protein